MENVLTFFEIQEHEFHKIIESTTTFVKSYFENTMSQSIKNYYSYLEELDSNQEFYLMISAEYKNNSEISLISKEIYSLQNKNIIVAYEKNQIRVIGEMNSVLEIINIFLKTVTYEVIYLGL
jgi:hypothetical protein